MLSAELGLGGPSGTRPGSARLVHQIIEDCENGKVERTLDELNAEVDVALASAGVPVQRRLRGVARAREETDAAELVRAVRRASRPPALSAGSSSTMTGRRRRLHRPDRSGPARVRDPHHRLQDRRAPTTRRRRTRASSSASTTLPSQEAEDLKEFRRSPASSSPTSRGIGARASSRCANGRSARRARRPVPERMREQLSGLVGRAPAPERGRALPTELAGRTASSAVQDALSALPRGPAVVRRRTVEPR